MNSVGVPRRMIAANPLARDVIAGDSRGHARLADFVWSEL